MLHADPKQKKGYIVEEVYGDGECGFTAFGVTREEAHKLLLANLQSLQDEKCLNLNLMVKERLLEDNFINYLYEKQIIPKEVTKKDIEEKIDDYAGNYPTLRACIDYDNLNKKWAHPAILQALAFSRRSELHIWRLDNNNNLIPHRSDKDAYPYDYACYKPPVAEEKSFSSQSRVDLLFVRNKHFDNVKFVGFLNQYPDDNEIIQPIQKNDIENHQHSERKGLDAQLGWEEKILQNHKQKELDAIRQWSEQFFEKAQTIIKDSAKSTENLDYLKILLGPLYDEKLYADFYQVTDNELSHSFIMALLHVAYYNYQTVYEDRVFHAYQKIIENNRKKESNLYQKKLTEFGQELSEVRENSFVKIRAEDVRAVKAGKKPVEEIKNEQLSNYEKTVSDLEEEEQEVKSSIENSKQYWDHELKLFTQVKMLYEQERKKLLRAPLDLARIKDEWFCVDINLPNNASSPRNQAGEKELKEGSFRTIVFDKNYKKMLATVVPNSSGAFALKDENNKDQARVNKNDCSIRDLFKAYALKCNLNMHDLLYMSEEQVSKNESFILLPSELEKFEKEISEIEPHIIEELTSLVADQIKIIIISDRRLVANPIESVKVNFSNEVIVANLKKKYHLILQQKMIDFKKDAGWDDFFGDRNFRKIIANIENKARLAAAGKQVSYTAQDQYQRISEVNEKYKQDAAKLGAKYNIRFIEQLSQKILDTGIGEAFKRFQIVDKENKTLLDYAVSLYEQNFGDDAALQNISKYIKLLIDYGFDPYIKIKNVPVKDHYLASFRYDPFNWRVMAATWENLVVYTPLAQQVKTCMMDFCNDFNHRLNDAFKLRRWFNRRKPSQSKERFNIVRDLLEHTVLSQLKLDDSLLIKKLEILEIRSNSKVFWPKDFHCSVRDAIQKTNKKRREETFLIVSSEGLENVLDLSKPQDQHMKAELTQVKKKLADSEQKEIVMQQQIATMSNDLTATRSDLTIANTKMAEMSSQMTDLLARLARLEQQQPSQIVGVHGTLFNNHSSVGNDVAARAQVQVTQRIQ